MFLTEISNLVLKEELEILSSFIKEEDKFEEKYKNEILQNRLITSGSEQFYI